MNELVARRPDCGFKHDDEFAHCPVCGRSGLSGWWCGTCEDWRISRACPECGGVLDAPAEVELGEYPAGSRVRVKFTVRNSGRKPLECPVSADPAITLAARRLALRPGAETSVLAVLDAANLLPGSRAFPIRFQTPVPVETRLVLDVVPAVARLEFAPSGLVF